MGYSLEIQGILTGLVMNTSEMLDCLLLFNCKMFTFIFSVIPENEQTSTENEMLLFFISFSGFNWSS